MMDKQQLERMYKHNLKVKKVLFIVSMALFAIATGLMVGFIIMYVKKVDVVLFPDLFSEEVTLTFMMLDLFSTAISAALVLLLFSLLVFARRARFAKELYDNYDQIYAEQSRMWGTKPSGMPNMDEPISAKPKGKYDDLIHEYEKLYEQGLITKEDLDKKKAELQA